MTVADTYGPLRVLIVGCGNIAGGFDQARPRDSLPYTHAGAYTWDGRFMLEACVEPDAARRTAFMQAWAVPAGFASLSEALADARAFDVISICSPTACHATDLERAIVARPRMIFCEKPVTAEATETRRLVEMAAVAGVPLAVNYTRRWDPDVVALRAAIGTGVWGTLRAVTGIYNKGVLNNGSHMLDLLYALLGPLSMVTVGRAVVDCNAVDPSVPLGLETAEGTPIHLACGHANDYALFELQLVFSGGVVTMEEGGMYWRERRAVDSETFKGYRTLDAGTRRCGGYPHAMLRAVDNLWRTLRHGDELASTGESALSTHQLCEQIVHTARTSQHANTLLESSP